MCNTIIIVAIILVVVVVAAGWFIATRLQESSAGEAALEATAVDETTLPTTLPFEFTAGHIVVDAVPEEGADPVVLILDTGAPVIISDDLAAQLGVERVGAINTVAIDGTVVSHGRQ